MTPKERLVNYTHPDQIVQAQIIWAATSRVRRLHPILLALIPKSPLTADDVDAMFGWGG